MAPKSNKGSTLQKKNSCSASKPLEPDKDREDLYGDDPPPLERTVLGVLSYGLSISLFQPLQVMSPELAM
ncbi:hypothetical protein PISMIDRAFT_16890 [Pisolithus microcarpus 441]|uniref:Uncharacterized protein n=1 Tax=Pisolithus microcarpus 441 TaxID=765257 RepID=A0A0C9YXN3_9AGAM|nr:hypothetical protein PISMIDRAFT_16890 [Pisolithus microcarpus 441]